MGAVKSKAMEMVVIPKVPVVLPFAVSDVTDDGVGDVFHVSSNLVSASRLWACGVESISALGAQTRYGCGGRFFGFFSFVDGQFSAPWDF